MIKSLKFVLILFTVVSCVKKEKMEIEGLALHLGCEDLSKDCQNIDLLGRYKANTILMLKKPEMVISKESISEAKMSDDSYGKPTLGLSLNEKAAKELEKLTRENQGKALVVVSGGKAVIAPIISGVISEGKLVVSTGTESDNKYLESLPWLKAMLKN